jgi:hypothetical protein
LWDIKIEDAGPAPQLVNQAEAVWADCRTIKKDKVVWSQPEAAEQGYVLRACWSLSIVSEFPRQ